MNVRAIIQDVFRQVFDDPTLTLIDDMDASSVANWDSWTHLNMIIASERALGVRLTTAEIARLREPGENVGSFIQLLEQKVAAK